MQRRAFFARERRRAIFTGEHGLRAGWGSLSFIALVVAGVFVARTLAGSHWALGPGPVAPAVGLLHELVPCAIVLGSTAVLVAIERRPFWTYGLGDQHGLRNLFAGFAAGGAFIALLLAVLERGGYLAIDREPSSVAHG